MLLLLLAAMQFDWQCSMRDPSSGKPFLTIAVKDGEKGPIIGMGNGEELQIIEGEDRVFRKVVSDKAALGEAGVRAAGVSREAVAKAIIFGVGVKSWGAYGLIVYLGENGYLGKSGFAMKLGDALPCEPEGPRRQVAAPAIDADLKRWKTEPRYFKAALKLPVVDRKHLGLEVSGRQRVDWAGCAHRAGRAQSRAHRG